MLNPFIKKLYFSWMACDYYIKVHLPRLTIIFMRAMGAQHMAYPFVSGWMKEWIAFLHHRGPHLKHLCPKWMSKKFLSAYDSLRNPIRMLIKTDGGDRKEILGLFWPLPLGKWPVLYCPKCLFNAAFYVLLLTSIHKHSPSESGAQEHPRFTSLVSTFCHDFQ